MSRLQLGFGCAPMLGRVGRRASLRALEIAWELGVRRFDIARSYGWGDAEGLLGEFLASRPRDEYRIVTKCGIVPARRSRLGTLVRSVGRGVYRRLRSSQGAVRALASRSFQPQYTHDPSALQQSFEQSLRELRIERVDVLLLHQFAPGDAGLDAIVEWFRTLHRTERIGGYGVCIEDSLAAGAAGLRGEWLTSDFVIQAPVQEVLGGEVDTGDAGLIAHSAFRYLEARQAASIAATPSDLADVVARLGAVRTCKTLVCSMFSEHHIRENCLALSTVSRREMVKKKGER